MKCKFCGTEYTTSYCPGCGNFSKDLPAPTDDITTILSRVGESYSVTDITNIAYAFYLFEKMDRSKIPKEAMNDLVKHIGFIEKEYLKAFPEEEKAKAKAEKPVAKDTEQANTKPNSTSKAQPQAQAPKEDKKKQRRKKDKNRKDDALDSMFSSLDSNPFDMAPSQDNQFDSYQKGLAEKEEKSKTFFNKVQDVDTLTPGAGATPTEKKITVAPENAPKYRPEPKRGNEQQPQRVVDNQSEQRPAQVKQQQRPAQTQNTQPQQQRPAQVQPNTSFASIKEQKEAVKVQQQPVNPQRPTQQQQRMPEQPIQQQRPVQPKPKTQLQKQEQEEIITHQPVKFDDTYSMSNKAQSVLPEIEEDPEVTGVLDDDGDIIPQAVYEDTGKGKGNGAVNIEPIQESDQVDFNSLFSNPAPKSVEQPKISINQDEPLFIRQADSHNFDNLNSDSLFEDLEDTEVGLSKKELKRRKKEEKRNEKQEKKNKKKKPAKEPERELDETEEFLSKRELKKKRKLEAKAEQRREKEKAKDKKRLAKMSKKYKFKDPTEGEEPDPYYDTIPLDDAGENRSVQFGNVSFNTKYLVVLIIGLVGGLLLILNSLSSILGV